MPQALRLAVFFATILPVVAGLHVYVYRRLLRDTGLGRWLRALAVALFALMLPAVVALRVFGAELVGSRALIIAFLFWLGAVVYTVAALLAADVGRAVLKRVAKVRARASASAAAPVDEGRRVFLARAVASSAVLAGGGVASFGTFRAFSPPQVTEVPIRLPQLPKALDGFTLVQLSDIHIGPVLKQAWFDELLARALAQKPDLLAVTGDLVDGTVKHLGPIVAALGRVRPRYGTHFCTGNHDYYSGADAWCAELERLGVNVLRNRAVRIGDAAASFTLAGVDDWGAARMGEPGYDLDAALRGVAPDAATVLLAHQPANFDEVASRGVGLQLSGHTHGGQMFPATLGASLIWGARNAGLSRTAESQLFVSRGCGFVGPPMRVGSPPEIVKIVLLAG